MLNRKKFTKSVFDFLNIIKKPFSTKKEIAKYSFKGVLNRIKSLQEAFSIF